MFYYSLSIYIKNSIAQSFRAVGMSINGGIRRSRRYSNIEGRERPNDSQYLGNPNPEGLGYEGNMCQQFQHNDEPLKMEFRAE